MPVRKKGEALKVVYGSGCSVGSLSRFLTSQLAIMLAASRREGESPNGVETEPKLSFSVRRSVRRAGPAPRVEPNRAAEARQCDC